MRRSRVLFLSPRVPNPPDKGDKIRTHHVFESLAARHDVVLAGFVDNSREARHLEALRAKCADLFGCPRITPLALARGLVRQCLGGTVTLGAYGSARLYRTIGAWSGVADFDAVYAFSGAMAPYALAARARRRLLDLCDVDSRKWSDFAETSRGPQARVYRLEGRRLRDLEHRWVGAFDAVTVATERERRELDPARRHANLHVVANGVRVDPQPRPASENCPDVVFVGAMDYRPNVEGVCWFVKQVWPRIRRHCRLARFQIVGRDPAQAVRRLARHEGVTVVGEVADVRPHLNAARVVVAPMPYSRGLPNKVLEAMAAVRPVVASESVVASLSAAPGRQILEGRGAGSFADAVVELLESDRTCETIAEGGLSYVRAAHDWRLVLEQFGTLLFGMGDAQSSQAGPFRGEHGMATEPRRRAASSRDLHHQRGNPVDALGADLKHEVQR